MERLSGHIGNTLPESIGSLPSRASESFAYQLPQAKTPSGQARVAVGGGEAAVHDDAPARGPVVCDERHYAEAPEGRHWLADEDMREAIRANLELLDSPGGGWGEGPSGGGRPAAPGKGPGTRLGNQERCCC